ncbi:MAG: SPOR domain-containing protein [Marinilabiliales bacterium]|nr:MAG: SPOR domain-containing protein [Marinilabiliales bacterium]
MNIRSGLVPGAIFVLFLLVSYNSFAQLDIWPYLKELSHDMNDDGPEFIRQADQQRQYAENLISVSAEAGRREGIEDGFGELFKASEILFDLLDTHMEVAKGGVPYPLPSEMGRASEMERKSASYIEKAGQLKKEAADIRDGNKAVSVLYMAWDLKMIAILHKVRALYIYQDFPMIYEYPWSYDYTVLEDSPREAKGTIEAGHQEEPGNNAEGQDIENTPFEEAFDTGIHYIIQIAAHTGEIGERQLNAIYQGEERVSVMFEDGWYKYFIGPYETYEEADSAMKTSGLRNVFIAAYYEGQRISVGEARRREAGGN